jgi:hypothetical protein
VQIGEAAGVDAFLMGEPWLLPCGGYGPVAAEADGVAGAIAIVPVLEVEVVRGELKNFGGHEWPAFKRRNFAAIDHSTLRATRPRRYRWWMSSVGGSVWEFVMWIYFRCGELIGMIRQVLDTTSVTERS